MLDEAFAARLRESKRQTTKKRYDKDPEFRQQVQNRVAEYQPIALEKRRERYHTDPEFRQKYLQQGRDSYARRKAAKQLQQ
jgi:hypothetical protein